MADVEPVDHLSSGGEAQVNLIRQDKAGTFPALETIDPRSRHDRRHSAHSLLSSLLTVVAFGFYAALGRTEWFFLDDVGLYHGPYGLEPRRSPPPAQRAPDGRTDPSAWRALWQVFGLRSYVPYVRVGHSRAHRGRFAGPRRDAPRERRSVDRDTHGRFVSVLRVRARRTSCGVSRFASPAPWRLVSFIYFWQITTDRSTSELGLGLSQDFYTLMCSGVGVAMVVVVGGTTAIRHAKSHSGNSRGSSHGLVSRLVGALRKVIDALRRFARSGRNLRATRRAVDARRIRSRSRDSESWSWSLFMRGSSDALARDR